MQESFSSCWKSFNTYWHISMKWRVILEEGWFQWVSGGTMWDTKDVSRDATTRWRNLWIKKTSKKLEVADFGQKGIVTMVIDLFIYFEVNIPNVEITWRFIIDFKGQENQFVGQVSGCITENLTLFEYIFAQLGIETGNMSISPTVQIAKLVTR